MSQIDYISNQAILSLSLDQLVMSIDCVAADTFNYSSAAKQLSPKLVC